MCCMQAVAVCTRLLLCAACCPAWSLALLRRQVTPCCVQGGPEGTSKGVPQGHATTESLHIFAEQSPCLALQADLAGPSHATHLLCGAWQRGT